LLLCGGGCPVWRGSAWLRWLCSDALDLSETREMRSHRRRRHVTCFRRLSGLNSIMGYHGEIPVTFDGGVFRPDAPLALPNGARGVVSVWPVAPNAESRRRAWEVIDRIRREKLIRLGGGPIKRDELYDRG